MTTPLFKEALVESKRLRDVATEEARQAVLESIAPMIKQMLDREIAGTMLFEEESPMDAPLVNQAPTDALVPPVDATVTPAEPTPSAPIAPPEAGLDMPMPDASGKITVDVESLFQKSEEPDAAEPPLPPPDEPVPTEPVLAAEPPAEPQPLAERFKLGLARLEEYVSVGRVEPVSTKASLLALYEMYDTVKSGPVDEARLELLYGKLLETDKQGNSYQQKDQRNMSKKSLRAFATALFEEASAGFGDGGEADQEVVNANESDKASNAAMKNSKSTPVDDPGKDAALKNGGAVGFSEGLDEDDELMQLENELREMLGDDEPADKEAMMEAKKKTLSKKLKKLKEEAEVLNRELKECGMDAAPVVVNIEVETGEGVEVNGPGGDDSDVVDLGAVEGDDEEIEIVDDTEEEVPADDDEDEEPKQLPGSLSEARRMRAENVALKKQLNETQLLTARSLFVNKLFTRENLSTEQKRRIVEYVDSAKNIQEAKAVYERIKRVLDQKVVKEGVAPKRKSGSGSAPTTTGSAKPLNESVTGPSFDTNRWATLAGIVKK